MAPRKKAPAGPTPVEAIVHSDKRANLPTADAEDFVRPEDAAVRQLRYPRDPSLDPQLVWKGKDGQDDDDLVVDAPPIYIQEKVDPRVLVENLRQTAKRPDDEPELTLFDTFDGLEDLDLVDFYRHEANWSNRMILGDSLQVMASLAEREALRGKVQMIYIDPPYGIRFGSNWQVSARKRDVKDGKLEDATREVEQIKAFRDTWELGIHSYLSYLRDRLVAARDLLTDSGSCFVQIGDENVHLVRSLMDEVFGSENFVSQIIFRKTTGKGGGLLDNTYDLLLWFARDVDALKYRQLFGPRGYVGDPNLRFLQASDGSTRAMTTDEWQGKVPIAAGNRPYRANPLTNQRPAGGSDLRTYEYEGRSFTPGAGTFRTDKAGMDKLKDAGRLLAMGRSLTFLRFLEDFPFQPVADIWDDTRTGGFADPKVYVVQTVSKVVERCMLMCTDPGDLVIDPTCGSGTTAYVAEQWGRRWITVDTSRVALALARQRLMGAKFPYYLLADSAEGRRRESELSPTPLPPASPTDDIRHGFVYERVQHITLKSIANNPDIREGMTRAEIDASIKRHADFELLYDKPYEDRKKVRVTGPFTVESLSPHRSIAFAPASLPDAERQATLDPDAPTFEQTILANLGKAGIQNGRKQERLIFEVVEPYAGTHIQAIGVTSLDADGSVGDGPDGDAPRRVGISIGPQYGTVGQAFIKAAWREASRAGDIDLVAVLGFSFDPGAIGKVDDIATSDESWAEVAGERTYGSVPVLLVRMNADLSMGEDLKKTGAGNLFMVFGEPDIDIRRVPADDRAGNAGGEQVEVELRGVDVYDPTTGEVRSNDTDRIALWMIDTNYNEESFFVRHCYFTGGQDPYKRLRTALKAEVDEDAWAQLYSTKSRPFPMPDTGKIAVKVINDYGDEVLQVFEV